MSNNTPANTSSSVPGMLLPTQKGMLAGTPGASAIAQGNLATQKLAALNKIGGRIKHRRHRKYGGAITTSTTASTNASTTATNNILVPQFSMQYTPQGGPGQDPNSIIQQNAAIGTQGAANAVFDKYAGQMGGFHMNTNTNKFQWGCYSGGKKTKKRRRTNKKKRTMRRRGKSHRNRRSRKY